MFLINHDIFKADIKNPCAIAVEVSILSKQKLGESAVSKII